MILILWTNLARVGEPEQIEFVVPGFAGPGAVGIVAVSGSASAIGASSSTRMPAFARLRKTAPLGQVVKRCCSRVAIPLSGGRPAPLESSSTGVDLPAMPQRRRQSHASGILPPRLSTRSAMSPRVRTPRPPIKARRVITFRISHPEYARNFLPDVSTDSFRTTNFPSA